MTSSPSRVARSLRSVLVTLVFAPLLALSAAVVANGEPLAPDAELALVAALEDARAGRAGVALDRLESLLERNPNFRLAQLVYADLLLARAGRVGAFGAAIGSTGSRLEELRAEALARLSHHHRRPPTDRLPASFLRLAPSQQRVVLVDQTRSRLYLFANDGGTPRLLGDYYVSTGRKGARKEREGDQRTPVGVYFITSRLGSEELDDFYGAGALPVNYPNEWDDRFGRTGYGIWIHGVPSDTYSRPPRASDGCMALTNVHLAPMLKSLAIGTTPVIIAEQVEWLGEAEVAARRDELLGALEAWRRDWESLDSARYARHYASDFHSDGMGLTDWLAHKRAVNARKRYARVGIEDLSMFAYPGEQNLVTVTYSQNYQSDNFAERSSKRQYWRQGADGRWRIVYEGGAGFRAEHFRGIPWSARSRLSHLER